MTGELFPDSPVFDFLPDESVFSLASRYHHLSGNSTPAQTGQLLFGDTRGGTAHDFSGFVDRLSTRMSTMDPSSVVMRHTILPFYLPFHPVSTCENWIARIRNGSPSTMKAEMGLLATRFSASHPLKACAECMENDRVIHGTPYWHVSHQLPGVTVCHTHHVGLLQSSMKISGQNRFGWVLPDEAKLNPISSSSPDPLAFRLSEGAHALWDLPVEFVFDPGRMRLTYVDALQNHSLYLVRSNRIDSLGVRAKISDTLNRCGLPDLEPWLRESRGPELIASRLERMLHTSSPRQMRHPLNHLIFILTLFETWSKFWATYERVSNCDDTNICADEQSNTIQHNQPATHEERLKLLELVSAGHSVTHAAKLQGVAVSTAMTWLAAEGIVTFTRPKILLPHIRERAYRLLQRGDSKESVAHAVGVSVQTITRLLFTVPGLHEKWQQARFSRAQSKARSDWLIAMKCSPQAASNEWRQLAPAAYAWLYRNDRPWLTDQIHNRAIAVMRHSTRVNWSQRDEQLEKQVIDAVVKTLEETNSKVKLTLASVCALVPTLKRHLSKLDKLPRTRQALLTITRQRSSRRSSSLPLEH